MTYLTSDPYAISVLWNLCLTYHHILPWLGLSVEVSHALTSLTNFNYYDEKDYLSFINMFVFILFRQFICKVSYTLYISSIVLMTWVDNIIVICYPPKRTPRHNGVSFMSCHLFWLNLWLSVTIGHVQSHASISQLNLFPLLNQPNYVHSYNSI